MQIIPLSGVVYTGHGCGKFFVALPWVISQIKELTGDTPYFGTLNLRLNDESIKQRKCLTVHNGMMIKPKNDYLPGYLYIAKIFDTSCSVILPDVPNYPQETLEILATENLRESFNITDGDTITVLVTLK